MSIVDEGYSTENFVTYAFSDPVCGAPRFGEGTITSRWTDEQGHRWAKVASTYGFAIDVDVDDPAFDVQFIPEALRT